MKLSDMVKSIFRQHKWYDHKVHVALSRSDEYTYSEATCSRCGNTFPVPLKHIDMGWWQGGCKGEKRLLTRELEKNK